MRGLVENVARFHALFRVPSLPFPSAPSAERVRVRIRLIREEGLDELLGALREVEAHIEQGLPDRALRPLLVKVADGLIDTIFVCVGTALEFGMADVMPELWQEVHRSNLMKLGGAIGPDGKIQKPRGWKAPDIYRILFGGAP